jgi:hypothetical protein
MHRTLIGSFLSSPIVHCKAWFTTPFSIENICAKSGIKDCPWIVSLMNAPLDLHFVFMDFLLWSCLEFRCHVYLDNVCASDKVTNAGNGLILTWLFVKMWFKVLCLFCRSYELICAWKGWLYVSLWKLLFVFLYHWHFGGLWTTFSQIIMSKSSHFQHLSPRVITKLPNSEQSYKGKVKTRKYINRQNQSTTGKLWKP